MKYPDKVVVVTGGGQGIGKTIAAMYLQAGAKVVVAELHASHKGYAEGLYIVPTDVADPNSVLAMVEIGRAHV